jgi:hypothetical protein
MIWLIDWFKYAKSFTRKRDKVAEKTYARLGIQDALWARELGGGVSVNVWERLQRGAAC